MSSFSKFGFLSIWVTFKALLSQKDIATSVAEDLLKQFAQEGELDLDPQSIMPQQQPTVDIVQNPPSNIHIAKEPTPVLAIGGPMARSATPRGRRAAIKGNSCFIASYFKKQSINNLIYLCCINYRGFK